MSKSTKVCWNFIPMPMKSKTKQCKCGTKSALNKEKKKKTTREVFNIIFVHIEKPVAAVHSCLRHRSFRKILKEINRITPVAKPY